jgi:hypothetical protein
MIKGTYIFYEDGQEIYRSNNILTKFGKRYLTNVIAGNINGSNKEIAIGIDSTTATQNDTKLGFEFYRVPVTLSSTDIRQNGVDGSSNPVFLYSAVFKTTLPQDISGIVKEIGLYPALKSSSNSYDSKFLSDFNNPANWKDANFSSAQQVASNARIGDILLGMSSGTSSVNEYSTGVAIDLSGYSSLDSLTIAYRQSDTNLSSFRVKFYTTDTDYYYAQVSGSTTGDKIATVTMGTVFSNAVGTPVKSNITKIGIQITPTSGLTTVLFDGLRINDEDTFDPIYGLISRSILSTPLTKLNGRQVDIEYKLDLSF